MKYPFFSHCHLLFILFTLGVSTTVFTQEQAVLATEAARFRAQVEKDGLALQQLLDDDLYYLHSNGLVENKADFIQSVAGGKIVYSRMTSTEQHLRLFGKTAILYGLVLVDGQYEGNAFNISLYYTSVYRKKRGKWLLLNWQSTKKP